MQQNLSSRPIDRSSPSWALYYQKAKEHFLYPNPFQGQLESIADICYAYIDLQMLHVVYDGPTGTGKSVIAYTVIKVLSDPDIQHVHRARFVTGTIQLQEQYSHDFKDIITLKGKTNYTCNKNAKHYGSYECLKNKKDCGLKHSLYIDANNIPFIKNSNSGNTFSYLGTRNLIKDNSTKTKINCPYLAEREQFFFYSDIGSTNINFIGHACPSLILKGRSGEISDSDKLNKYGPDGKLSDFEYDSRSIPTFSDFVVLDECHKLEETLLNIGVFRLNHEQICSAIEATEKKALNFKSKYDVLTEEKLTIRGVHDVSTNLSKLCDYLTTHLSQFIDVLHGEKKYSLQKSNKENFVIYASYKTINSAKQIKEDLENMGYKIYSIINKYFKFELKGEYRDMKSKRLIQQMEQDHEQIFSEFHTTLESINELADFMDLVSQLKPNSMLHYKYFELSDDVINELKRSRKKFKFKKSKYDCEIRFTKASDISNHLIFRKGFKFLHMSATVCGYDYHLDKIGINKDHAIFIQAPPSIPLENRIIYNCAVSKMKSNNLDQEVQKTIDFIDELIESEKIIENKHRGFIFTPSFALAQTIRNHSKNKGLFYIPSSAQDGLKYLKKLQSMNKEGFVITPSFIEGVDLKNDLCRYQIITKIPFLFLGDEIVQVKMGTDKEFYGRTTLTKLIQITGRSIRGVDDWAKTYILDARLSWFLNQNDMYAPSWWLQSIRNK